MRIIGKGTTTYLYLSGVSTKRPLQLGEGITLIPASCSPKPDDIIKASKSEVDLGVMAIFLRQIRAQLRIEASDPKTLATKSWNSLWDAILLSSICQCEIECNLQCDNPAEEFGPGSQLEVTNYHLRGLTSELHEITNDEEVWIEQNFGNARRLLEQPSFSNAAHSLSSYRWHPHPRVQLAILWSGIEGLFDIESELVFRLSLYIARYLAPDDQGERSLIFSQVKQLYKHRSTAVHGGVLKENASKAVDETAALLRRLYMHAVDSGLPAIDSLAP
jgi:hypothetical protein